MPIIQRNTNSLSNLVYTTGLYINPSWIISLAPAKVGSGVAQWNAAQLRGYPISTGTPTSGQVLAWTSSGWFPTTITGGSAIATGVTSFNSRTGVVTLTSADVTGALTYTPYNNANPSGYISSGYYTANGGVTLSGSNFSMGGTGTLHQLVFDDDVIRVGNQAGNNSDSQYSIMIGRQAGVNSTNIYSIMLGTFAGTKASGSYNTLIGYSAGSVADPYSSGIGGNNLEISSSGSNFLASILTGKSNKINIQETIVGDNTTKKLAIGKVGASNLNPNATLEVIANISTDKVLISKGAISQTANLIEAQSSSGTTLFSVDSGGYISTPSSGLATWNASLLNGYSVSNASPSSGQVLTWNGTSWTPVSTALNGNNIFTGNVVLNGAVSGVLSNTNINTIDSTPYSSGDCIKYIIRTKYGNTTQGSEILLVSDGTDTYMTEYAQVYTSGQLITFSADYNSSNIRLLGQAKYSNTSVHMMKVLIS